MKTMFVVVDTEGDYLADDGIFGSIEYAALYLSFYEANSEAKKYTGPVVRRWDVQETKVRLESKDD